MTRETDKRPALQVSRDDDGGLTVHEPQSGLVVSIIATSPLASGPKGLYVEVYAYQGGDVLAEMLPAKGSDEPVALRLTAHPTTAYYAKGGAE